MSNLHNNPNFSAAVSDNFLDFELQLVKDKIQQFVRTGAAVPPISAEAQQELNKRNRGDSPFKSLIFSFFMRIIN